MTLDVEVEITVDNHHHRGVPTPKGEVVTVSPNRAEMLIAKGFGKKVGVKDSEGAGSVPLEEVLVEAEDEQGEEQEEEETPRKRSWKK